MLTDEEKDILNREIVKDARVKELEFCDAMDEHVYDRVQAEVFSEWGVMCPHPIQDVHGHSCTCCGAALFSHAQAVDAIKNIWGLKLK